MDAFAEHFISAKEAATLVGCSELPQEVHQWLGRSKATLHRWIQQGKLTPLTDSRQKSHWFARSAVMQLAPVPTAVVS